MDHLGVDLGAFGELGFVGAELLVGVLKISDAGVDALERRGDAVAGGAAAFELGFQVGCLWVRIHRLTPASTASCRTDRAPVDVVGSWHPRRHYQAWHDRAVYHFLTIDEHRQQHLRTLDAATAPDAIAVFGCFAPDGPTARWVRQACLARHGGLDAQILDQATAVERGRVNFGSLLSGLTRSTTAGPDAAGPGRTGSTA